MSISSTIGQQAARDPAVGAAVAAQATESAILSSLQTGDPSAALLGAINSQALTASTLLAGLTPNLGQHLDAHA